MQAVKSSNGGKYMPYRRDMLWIEEDRDRLYPRATIDALPDNVLLETFELYLGKDGTDIFDQDHNYDGWQRLVHVCRRWRCIVFASPRRLDLKLRCIPQPSINSETLDIWPELPIVILVRDMHYMPSGENESDIIAALRHHNRVCKIYYCRWRFQHSWLKEFAAIDKPFPALRGLELSAQQPDVPVLPDSFLGGSAPRLRSLHLDGIPYPSIGTLLSSSTNLLRLTLWNIPHSGYIAPETIVPFLSMLLRLESLGLGFKHPRSRAHRTSRYPPPLTRVVFPNLTSLDFHGETEYLEDILCQMETPLLVRSYLRFFNQLVFDTPLLGHFILRTEIFMTIHTARVDFRRDRVWVTFLGRQDREALSLQISCESLDWQLSAVAQVLDLFLSSIPTLKSLKIVADRRENRQNEIEVIQWRDFLRPFIFVEQLALTSKDSIQLIAPALQELTGESVTDVLPALQNLFLWTYAGWQPSGPLKEVIEQFIDTRQLYGHPVSVHY